MQLNDVTQNVKTIVKTRKKSVFRIRMDPGFFADPDLGFFADPDPGFKSPAPSINELMGSK